MRQKLVAGNWKMHGSRGSVDELLAALLPGMKQVTPEVVVCPAYLHLARVLERCAGSPVAVGAQDCSHMASGAYTGEVSAEMLADLGCRWVILGHSERRQYHAESDELVSAKLSAAVAAGLQPIVCIGETREQRESGEAQSVVGGQLLGALSDQPSLEGVVLAYEPVWAIGTGLTATPEQAGEMHAYIRDCLGAVGGAEPQAIRILYGGSVRAGNAAELFAQRDIDGALVGGASLVAEDFLAIVGAAAGR